MSRYEPRDEGGWWPVRDTVERIDVGIGNEATACIIAFALNAVARGDDLAALSQRKPFDPPGVIDYYTGPTEGVAP